MAADELNPVNVFTRGSDLRDFALSLVAFIRAIRGKKTNAVRF
jgi:hypothetical protein